VQVGTGGPGAARQQSGVDQAPAGLIVILHRDVRHKPLREVSAA
jgi:hypothetical protein